MRARAIPLTAAGAALYLGWRLLGRRRDDLSGFCLNRLEDDACHADPFFFSYLKLSLYSIRMP